MDVAKENKGDWLDRRAATFFLSAFWPLVFESPGVKWFDVILFPLWIVRERYRAWREGKMR